jgi:uncharacterized RDD family membrane protein YckC
MVSAKGWILTHESIQTNSFVYAKLRFRWLALLIDGTILNWVINILTDHLHRYAAIENSESMNVIYGSGLFGLVFVVYSVAFEGYLGATIGKYIFKIRVIDISGKRISYTNSLIRNLAKFIPFEILSCFAGRNKIIHDKLANAAVIKI